jgi:two-component system, LytTR family, response regulator
MSAAGATDAVRAVIVEDEPIARDALVRMIGDVDWIALCGTASDGDSGLSMVMRLRPELLLVDIQMPGLNGISLVERVPFELGVIFTTAFDEHAVMAFELGALDYLRKPFGSARLEKALQRARPQLERIRRDRVSPITTLGRDERAESHDTTTSALAASADSDAPSVAARLSEVSVDAAPLTRLFVRDRGRVIPIRTDELIRCEAEDDYVALYVAGKRHLLYVRLSGLEQKLDSTRFLRIHRSHLINVDRIAALEPYDANRLAVRMSDGSRVVASRAGTTLLRALMR